MRDELAKYYLGDAGVIFALWEGQDDPILLLTNLLTRVFGEETFFSHSNQVTATLAIVVLSFLCGGLGSLVVANRMAFFSDALAHIAFAGAAFGLLIALLTGTNDEAYKDYITLIM